MTMTMPPRASTKKMLNRRPKKPILKTSLRKKSGKMILIIQVRSAKKKKWVEKLYKGKPRVYHISTHGEDGKWQVRLANGEKAIRLFDTQAEGIDFARGLLKTMGGSIRVHSVHGAIRKAGW